MLFLFYGQRDAFSLKIVQNNERTEEKKPEKRAGCLKYGQTAKNKGEFSMLSSQVHTGFFRELWYNENVFAICRCVRHCGEEEHSHESDAGRVLF